jgi:hypothetical protein
MDVHCEASIPAVLDLQKHSDFDLQHFIDDIKNGKID